MNAIKLELELEQVIINLDAIKYITFNRETKLATIRFYEGEIVAEEEQYKTILEHVDLIFAIDECSGKEYEERKKLYNDTMKAYHPDA